MSIDDSAADLIATLITHSADQLNYTTNQLMNGYRQDAITGQVTLDLIRERIADLFYGPYQPSQQMILAALYPSKKLIDELVQERLTE